MSKEAKKEVEQTVEQTVEQMVDTLRESIEGYSDAETGLKLIGKRAIKQIKALYPETAKTERGTKEGRTLSAKAFTDVFPTIACKKQKEMSANELNVYKCFKNLFNQALIDRKAPQANEDDLRAILAVGGVDKIKALSKALRDSRKALGEDLEGVLNELAKKINDERFLATQTSANRMKASLARIKESKINAGK